MTTTCEMQCFICVPPLYVARWKLTFIDRHACFFVEVSAVCKVLTDGLDALLMLEIYGLNALTWRSLRTCTWQTCRTSIYLMMSTAHDSKEPLWRIRRSKMQQINQSRDSRSPNTKGTQSMEHERHLHTVYSMLPALLRLGCQIFIPSASYCPSFLLSTWWVTSSWCKAYILMYTTYLFQCRWNHNQGISLLCFVGPRLIPSLPSLSLMAWAIFSSIFHIWTSHFDGPPLHW